MSDRIRYVVVVRGPLMMALVISILASAILASPIAAGPSSAPNPPTLASTGSIAQSDPPSECFQTFLPFVGSRTAVQAAGLGQRSWNQSAQETSISFAHLYYDRAHFSLDAARKAAAIPLARTDGTRITDVKLFVQTRGIVPHYQIGIQESLADRPSGSWVVSTTLVLSEPIRTLQWAKAVMPAYQPAAGRHYFLVVSDARGSPGIADWLGVSYLLEESGEGPGLSIFDGVQWMTVPRSVPGFIVTYEDGSTEVQPYTSLRKQDPEFAVMGAESVGSASSWIAVGFRPKSVSASRKWGHRPLS